LEGLQLNEKAAHAKFITSKKRVADALIKAPISGYINKMFLKEGGMIGAAVPVCELVNTRSLKMSVKVDENEVVKIKKGQGVEVNVVSWPGNVLSGIVTGIGVKADYALQYDIELMVTENPEEKLKAGMVATAIFIFKDDEEGPVITQKALVGSAKDPQVYIVEGDVAHIKSVKIAYAYGEFIKIADGLSVGDRLVVAGIFNLRDGMQVKVIE
jgi:RND family efflux transporter MFP subunit